YFRSQYAATSISGVMARIDTHSAGSVSMVSSRQRLPVPPVVPQHYDSAATRLAALEGVVEN
ncbi:MAG: hypothetical protein AAF666_20085, partial [Pseudomonadota bacterium]